MIKKRFYLLLFVVNAFSQNSGIVEYKYIYDESNEQKSTSQFQMQVSSFDKRLASYATEHQYLLSFNQIESFYKVVAGMKPDDIDKAGYELSKSKLGAGVFYQNLKDKIVLNQKKTMHKLYLVKYPIQHNWVIIYEKKYILGYKCYKAITKNTLGQKIVAWFTPDIPLSFGPAGYAGTPGFILELQYLRNILKAKKIDFAKNVNIVKPTKGILVSQQELKTLSRKWRLKLKEKYFR